jgi:hypothetical protein
MKALPSEHSLTGAATAYAADERDRQHPAPRPSVSCRSRSEVERRIAAGEIVSAWTPSHQERTQWRATGAEPAEPTW